MAKGQVVVPTLLLLRHAKAVAPERGDDAARVLTDGGKAEALALGAYLREQGLLPDRALVSPAARTRQTLEGVMDGLGCAIPTRSEPSLYNATASQTRDLLAKTDDAVDTLLVIGHNPGIMDLALDIAGSGDLQDFEAIRARFPPCSLVAVTFESVAWRDARSRGGRLDRFVTPDQLASRS